MKWESSGLRAIVSSKSFTHYCNIPLNCIYNLEQHKIALHQCFMRPSVTIFRCFLLQYSNIDTIFPLSSVQSQPTELRLWFCNTSLKLLVRLIDIWHFRSDGEPLSWLPATLINFAFYWDWDISHSKTYFYPHRYTINFEREERRIQVNIVKSKATWSACLCCLQQILFYSPHSWLTQWHINVMMTGISDQMWHLKHSLWHKSVQP